MKISKIILALIIAQILFLFVPITTFGQTESLDGVQYTPPKGWTKTPKQGAMVFTDVNKTANTFCVLTVYGLSPGSGDPHRDFADKWKELVVTPFAAEAEPKTESQPAADGWTATAGGSLVDMNGIKSAAILTVVSGYGKTASILAIFNDETYSAQMQSVINSIKPDKSVVSSNPPPAVQNDPFPDRPGYAPQKPLSGTLKMTITMADLAGTWNNGAASVETYIDPSTGNYSGTDTTFYSDHHAINADGSFEYKFTGRTSNHTVRESDSGNVILSGGLITFKFKGRSSYRYQLISFMTQSNGTSILSLVHLGENDKEYDSAWLRLECGHANGIIHCAGGEEWVRLGSGLKQQ